MQNTLTLSKDIYQDAVEETRGQDFADTADELDEQAEQLKELSRQTSGEIKDVVPEARNPQEGAKEDIIELSDETKEKLKDTLKGAKDQEETQEILEETAEHLEEGAEDLRDATDGKEMENKEHEGDILGQAKLEEEGTQSGDAAKLEGTTTVVDKDKAAGLVTHEVEHTKQAKQELTQVSIGDKPAEQKPISNDLKQPADKNTVNATELVETAAMIEQKKRAPQSFNSLHDSYKATYRKVLGVLPDEQAIVEMARRSDGLEQLGRKVREKRGVKEPQVTMAG